MKNREKKIFQAEVFNFRFGYLGWFYFGANPACSMLHHILLNLQSGNKLEGVAAGLEEAE